jgi:hypothetical protein
MLLFDGPYGDTDMGGVGRHAFSCLHKAFQENPVSGRQYADF